MGVKYEDYYETLGVARTATPDEIQSAYRKLTRKYHPDVSKEPDAEAKYGKINEAYEVLKDPDKRKKYDMLGANWKDGQNFDAPPGFDNVHFDFGGQQGGGFSPDGFSDFFEMFFGQEGPGGAGRRQGFGGARPGRSSRSGRRSRRGEPRSQQRPAEIEIEVTVADLYHCASRHIEVQFNEANRQGLIEPRTVKLDVTIPPGSQNGSKIRIRGEGPIVGHTRSDLMLRLKLKPDPRFTVVGSDLKTTLKLTPWESVLGAKLPVPTVEGSVTVTVPAGSHSGQKLRLRGKGLPKRDNERGDLLAEVQIVFPTEISDAERTLWEQLRDGSNFDPRS